MLKYHYYVAIRVKDIIIKVEYSMTFNKKEKLKKKTGQCSDRIPEKQMLK